MSTSSIAGLGALSGFLLLAASASAEPKDSEARALAKEAMDTDYLGTQFADAAQKLQQALKTCGKEACSAPVRAQLHLDLGVVYIAGLQKKDKGAKEMQAAVAADPSVQLSPDFSTPEVEKAYLAAGGVKGEGEATSAKRAHDDDQDEDDDEEKHRPPAASREAQNTPPGGSVLNWFSASFQLDLLSYKDTVGVCAGAPQYQCFLQGQQYAGPLYLGSGDQLAGGVGFATKRLLVGYERLLLENVTAGVRLGFAFGGSPVGFNGKAFLPIHAEARGSYWFGATPFARDGFRPYGGLAVGLGEVDGHVTVEYYEDARGYNAGAKGKLDAWRKTGKTFAGLHVGAAYAFSKEQQLFVELRLLQMLGAAALGGAVSFGYAFGM